MATEFLTAHKVKAVRQPGIYLDGRGLRLIVNKCGSKRWELWIKIRGRRRQLGLGVYPEVRLQDAREKADEIRRSARNGVDLQAKREAQRAGAVTFREVFETYFARKRQQLGNKKHLKQWPSTMETYVFPVIGNVPIEDVNPDHIIRVLEPIWYEKDETAKRVLQRMEAVFKSAIRLGKREKASPCIGVAEELGTRHREARHHPAMPYESLPDFIARLREPTQRAWQTTRPALEFLILTATRSSETREAMWSEFDLEKGLWVIPKERMGKSRKKHVVPLSRRCLEILYEMKAVNPCSSYVFEGTKKGRPLSDMTLTKLLRDAGLGKEATVHGFRSSFKDWCAEREKVADEVSEAALAHTNKDRVKAAYLRTNFLEQRKPLMERWAKHCGSGRVKPPAARRDTGSDRMISISPGRGAPTQPQVSAASAVSVRD